MKINGETPEAPVEEVLVLPRGEKVIVFTACAVDMDEFNKFCPEPKPPGKMTPKGYVPLPDDPGYKEIVTNHNAQRFGYLVVNSLAPSKIEWDIVKADNPATWPAWKDDLKAAKFTDVEVQRVLQLVLDANCLNEAKIERARELFVLGKAAESAAISSQSSAPANMPSGEPASA